MNQDNTLECNHNELEHQFKKNLLFFGSFDPKITSFIQNCTPQQYSLGYDEKNDINIWCKTKWFYNSSPISIAKEQTTQSVLKPEVLRLQPSTHSQQEYRFLHQYFLDQINCITPRTHSINNSYKNVFTPSMIVFGIGLGHHISKILNKIQVKNLHLYEPEPEFFYLSLFTTDYESIYKHFEKKSQVSIILNNEWRTLAGSVQHSLAPSSLHNGCQIQLIRHYNNEHTISAYQETSQYYGRFFDNQGFMEDECLGVSHFLTKLESNLFLLKDNTGNYTHNLTALIVGSGPSLDNDMNDIKKVKDKVIIISCSSSLSALHANGIQPHFHVESERLYHMVDYFEKFKDKKYLNNITLLTLNPTHPEIGKHFKNTILAFKPNDYSTILWKKFSKINGLLLHNSSPTSGNSSLAFAIAMGFKTLILTGLDFGQKNNQYHHSKSSLYNTIKERQIDCIDSDLETTGNFGGTIGTTLLLDKAKQTTEILLNKNNITCYNCSDGAHIQGTIPIKLNKLSNTLLNNIINDELRSFNTHFFKNCVEVYEIDDCKRQTVKVTDEWASILEETSQLARQFRIETIPTTLTSWYDFFDSISILLDKISKQNPDSIRLLTGSISSLQTAAATILFSYRVSIHFNDISESIACIWNQYIEAIPNRCIDTNGCSHNLLRESIESALQHYIPKAL